MPALMPPPSSSSSASDRDQSSAGTSLDTSSGGSTALGTSSSASSIPEMDLDGGKINPLAGMGLSDADYHAILRGMIDSDALAGVPPNFALVATNAKRARGGGGGGFDDVDDDDMEMVEDGREGKRSRFEVVE